MLFTVAVFSAKSGPQMEQVLVRMTLHHAAFNV